MRRFEVRIGSRLIGHVAAESREAARACAAGRLEAGSGTLAEGDLPDYRLFDWLDGRDYLRDAKREFQALAELLGILLPGFTDPPQSRMVGHAIASAMAVVGKGGAKRHPPRNLQSFRDRLKSALPAGSDLEAALRARLGVRESREVSAAANVLVSYARSLVDGTDPSFDVKPNAPAARKALEVLRKAHAALEAA